MANQESTSKSPIPLLLVPTLKPASTLNIRTGGFLSPGLNSGTSTGSGTSISDPNLTAHIPYPSPNSSDAKPLLPEVKEAHVAFVVAASSADISAFQQIADSIKNTRVQIKSEERPDKSKQVIVQISGPEKDVSQARTKILRSLPVITTQQTQGPATDLLAANGSLKPGIAQQFATIGKSTNTTISVTSAPTKAGEVTLDITGLSFNVEKSKLQLLIALDEIAGLHSTRFNLPAKIIPSLAGRRRIAIENMMKEHGTNIYIPTSATPVDQDAEVEIAITGTKDTIENVKNLLSSLATKKKATIMSQTLTITPHKAEWILLTSWDKIRDIMDTTGVFIGFPAPDVPIEQVTVYADKPALMTRAINKLLNLLATHISGQVFLSSSALDLSKVTNSSLKTPDFETIQALAYKLAKTGSEVFYLNSTLYLYGEEGDVHAAISAANKDALISAACGEYKLTVELISEHRDFLSGKKNGKINKVMRTSGAKVKFYEFNSHNMLVDISSNTFTRTQEGYQLIKDELPVDLHFFVPENAHKRIIGVGGKHIQAVMKQFGVYVKFASAEEFLNVGGMLPQEENVVVRTPAKNASNLYSLKQNVLEMVYGQVAGPVTLGLSVPRRFHFWLTTTKHTRIADIESRTGITIKFPARELGSPLLTLQGIESQAHLAASMIKDLLPVQLDYNIPPSIELKKLFETNDWKDTERRLQHELEVWISARVSEDDGVFVLRMWTARVTSGFLKAAVAQVLEVLHAHKVPLLATQSTTEEIPQTPVIGKKADFAAPERVLVNTTATGSVDAPAIMSPLTAGGSITVQNISSGLVAREAPVLAPAPAALAGLESPKRRLSPFKDDAALTLAISQVAQHNPASASATSAAAQMSARRISVQRNLMPSVASPGLRKPNDPFAIVGSTHSPTTGSNSNNWRRNDVDSKLSKFLEQLDLSNYIPVFAGQEVDYDMFVTLTENDFKELGVTFGARRKILLALKDLKTAKENEHAVGKVTASPSSRMTLRPTATTFTPISTKIGDGVLNPPPGIVSPSLASPRPNGFNTRS